MKIQTVANYSAAAPKRAASEAPQASESAPAPADTASVSNGKDDAAPEREWTILYYLNGNNALSGQAVATMRQLEYIGTDDKIALATQVARPKGLVDKWSKDWSGVRRYGVEHNGEKLTPAAVIGDSLTSWMPGKSKGIASAVQADLGDADMGKAETLQEFIQWGMEKYPAKRTMVVMMGPSEGLSGMMQDVIHDSKMSAADLGQAFRNVKEKTGKDIDVLTFDGSATNTAEIAYELKDSVKYLVGSQGIQGGAGFPLSMVSNELKNANGDHVQEPKQMVQYWMLMNSMAGGTVSALDLTKMDGVKTSWDNLSTALLAANVSGEKLNELLEKTQDFQGRSLNQAYQNSRDAIHFAELVKSDADITDPKVKEAAQQAIDSINGAIVGQANTGKYTKEAHGLSVFAPTQYGFFRPDGEPVATNSVKDANYSATKFAQDTAWDDVLAKAGADSKFNNTLKKLGFSEATLDSMYSTTAKVGGVAGGLLGLTGTAAWINGMNAWRGAGPMMGTYGAVAGVIGSGKAAYDAINDGVYAATQLRDKDAVIDQAFNLGKAGAMGVANLGYVVPQLKPYAATAGALMFFSPWIKDVYGVVSEYQKVKDGIELGMGAGAPVLDQWGSAAVNYYSNKNQRDHAERSLVQKLFG